MVEFVCPYCDDYTGGMDSVRAHIRAKTDVAHKGKSGFEDESENALREQGEPPGEQSMLDPPSSPAESPAEPADDPTTGDEQAMADGDDADEQDDDGAAVATLVAIGLFVVYLWVNDKIDLGSTNRRMRYN